jgi:hypothetical protein
MYEQRPQKYMIDICKLVNHRYEHSSTIYNFPFMLDNHIHKPNKKKKY